MEKRFVVTAYFALSVDVSDNDPDPDTTIGDIIDCLENGSYVGYPNDFTGTLPSPLEGFGIDAREVE